MKMPLIILALAKGAEPVYHGVPKEFRTMTTHGFDTARLERINDVIARNYVDTAAIPDALALVWRRGDLVWRGMSGQMDLSKKLPMREDAIFRLYSTTKPVTA